MTDARPLEPGEWELWDAWMRAQRLLTRELERRLQRDCGLSKPEFSVLVTLREAAGREMRVGELAESLDWDKSRVSHQLTRMEKRGFVERTRYGADGRRAGVGLTAEGRRAAQSAVLVHGRNIRRHFLDPLPPEQASAIREWSERAVDRLEPRRSEAAGDDAS
jgi:DNA-binding MarR family transcriptional regulator